jgi:hypothetical protein
VVEELRLTKLELERAAQEKMAVIMRLAKAEATGGFRFRFRFNLNPTPKP